ncbi:Uncharacterized protein FWK35_00022713 [Aphis craccivora]|uniref:Uncharacterized protein n=1 Tax=Aphis craccivora TaxID=307492 RepID=A0A6G0YYR9_APHCR|nr:Uncharacterized protein FWK35_00022713 [Aphis craccivora]
MSGASGTSTGTYLNEASTLVLETTENNQKNWRKPCLMSVLNIYILNKITPCVDDTRIQNIYAQKPKLNLNKLRLNLIFEDFNGVLVHRRHTKG